MVKPNKRCEITGKGYKKAANRSHSNQKTLRKQQPNLQWYKLPSGKRIKVSTKAIKALAKGKIKVPEELKN